MSRKRIILRKEYLLLGAGEIPIPLELVNLFNNKKPLEVETGSGTGTILAWMARQNPDRNFIGMEKELKYARLSAWKLEREGCENARVFHIDSREAVKYIFPTNSINVWRAGLSGSHGYPGHIIPPFHDRQHSLGYLCRHCRSES